MKTIAQLERGERELERGKLFFFKKKAAVINSSYCTGHAQKMTSLLIQDDFGSWPCLISLPA